MSYSNSVKEEILGVDAEDIGKYGAVSEIVAEKMALGVRIRLKADIGLSVTGIAGPGGGSEEKPVGTVFIGLAVPGSSLAFSLRAVGKRDIIRHRSANMALDRLRIWLLTGE